jgi:spore coat protein U-like protein
MPAAVKRTRGRWVLALLLAGPMAAHAQQCFVSGAFGLNFGEVNERGKDAHSQLTYTCAPDYSGAGATLHYRLCLSLGPGQWSAGQPTRRLGNYNGDFLSYDLFSDPARTRLIGAEGSLPVYQLDLTVPPGAPRSGDAQIYGRVYPGQSVNATAIFQEQGINGVLRYRYSRGELPASTDCSSVGSGGGSVSIGSSGVYASVENSCWIVADDLNFGSAPPPLRPLHAQTTIRMQCPPQTAWRISLDTGRHFDGSNRRMAGGSGFVRYLLFRDAGLTAPWGQTPDEMAMGTTDVTGNVISLTVYGEVPVQTGVERGLYSDTVLVTLYY